MPATLQLHLTRQPILDRRNQLFGYELLFQPQKGGAGAQLDDVYDAVLAGLPGLDLNLIADGRAAVITMGQNAILSGRLEEMEPRGVILALDEHVKPTPDVIEAVQRLKAHGYRIALDNMFYDGTQDALLAEAEFAKIETLALNHEELSEQVQFVGNFGVTLIAEQVESEAEYEDCVKLGFNFFQGFSYFLSRAKESGVKPSENTMAIMRILNLLGDPNVRDPEVEAAFRSDPKLTFQLLKMVNSAAMGGRGIESIGHALRLLGRGAIHRWLALILATQGGRGEAVRFEVIKSSLLRARMCEAIGSEASSSLGLPAKGTLFLVGLFSQMDSLTGRPMADIMKGLEISENVKAALIDRSGTTGQLLASVEAYEDADWDKAEANLEGIGIDSDGLSDWFLDALTWATNHLSKSEDD